MRLVLYLLAALLLLWQEVSSFVPGPRSRIRFGLYVGKSGQSTGKRGANAKSGKASKSGNNAFTKKDSFHGRAGGTKGTGTGAGAKKGSRSSGRGSEDGRSFIVSDSSGDRDLMKGGKMVDKMAKRQESKIQKKADRRDSDKRSEEADAAALRKKMDSGPARNFAEKTVWGQAIINCRTFSIDSPKEYEFLGSYKDVQKTPILSSPEVAFIGRSNVGKSSLLNCLTGANKKIAIVGKTPGRTQCINMFKCADKEGDIAVLVDLPGYGFAKLSRDAQEQISGFLEGYLTDRGALRLVVMLVDSRRDVQAYDQGMIEFLEEQGLQYVVVATKVDKLSKNELECNLGKIRKDMGLRDGQPLPFSSVAGTGRRALWSTIRDGLLGSLDGEEEEDGDDKDEDGDDYHGGEGDEGEGGELSYGSVRSDSFVDEFYES